MYSDDPNAIQERPFGFLLVRFYESSDSVPQRVINPLDIASYTGGAGRSDFRDRVILRLKNGTSHRLFMISEKEFSAMVDTAMRERLRLVEGAPKEG